MHGGDIYRNEVELDFSVNINPLGIPDGVRRALTEAVSACTRYPDIRCEALRAAIGEMTGVAKEHILCGNGASELFTAIIHAVKPRAVLIPVPSFSGYETAARAGGAKLCFYEMKQTSGFCLDAGFLECLTPDVDLLFLANPNNPVGNCVSPELLEIVLARCEENGIIAVVDECFLEFTENGELDSLFYRGGACQNLIVVRAFTKIFAIPGVRLGYLVCREPHLRELIREQLSEWNVSVFAQSAGIAAAKEKEYVRRSVQQVRTEREYLTKKLQRLGITVYPSEADYLMLDTKLPLAEELLKRRILIRDCRDYRGLSAGYYRIAVRTREENERLLAAIEKIRAEALEAEALQTEALQAEGL